MIASPGTPPATSIVRDVLIIGIAGGMGSKKSSLAHLIALSSGIPVIKLKWFLRDRAPVHDPASYRMDDIVDVISRLSAAPGTVFSYHGHNITGAPVVIIVGLHAFSCLGLAQVMNVKVFVDCAADIRLCRMVRKLAIEDTPTGDLMRLLDQYEAAHRASHEHMTTQRALADIIVSTEEGWSVLSSILQSTIRQRV